jgi:hypothetical protein
MVDASGLPSTLCVFLPWIQGCSRARAAEGRCRGSLQVHMRSQLVRNLLQCRKLIRYQAAEGPSGNEWEWPPAAQAVYQAAAPPQPIYRDQLAVVTQTLPSMLQAQDAFMAVSRHGKHNPIS